MGASRRRTRQGVLVVVVALGAGGAAGACSSGSEASCEDTLTCTPYCNGECVPHPDETSGYGGPVLLWLGAQGAALPACPQDASRSKTLYGDLLSATPACDRCACSAPACELPAGVTASTTRMCDPGPPDATTPLRPPADWDGACFARTPIPPERVVSIAFEPPTERPCTRIEAGVPRSEHHDEARNWATVGLVCRGDVITEGAACNKAGLSGDDTKVCFPSLSKLEPAQHFAVCVARADENLVLACPDEYPYQVTLYHGADNGQCTPCDCVATRPSVCEASVSIYEDAACTVSIANAAVPTAGVCLVPPPGASLGSVSATWTKNAPGACAPTGGQPIAERKTYGPVTFCCLTNPERQPATNPFPVP